MSENRALFFFDYVDLASWAVELWLTELLPLNGVAVEIHYVLRPSGKPQAVQQNNKHVTFWLRYFETTGAKVRRVIKVR